MFIDSAWRWAFSWEKSSALQAEKAAKALGHLNQIEVYETRATYNKYANGLISAYRQRHASPGNLYNKADATTWGPGVDQAKTTFFEMETYAGLYEMVSTDDIRAYREEWDTLFALDVKAGEERFAILTAISTVFHAYKLDASSVEQVVLQETQE